MPRLKIEIDIAEVERLAGLGLTQEEIALSLRISESTLYKSKRESTDFAEAIKRGRATAASVISNKLFDLASAGNLGAIVWYEKTRRGLSDRVQQEITGRDGAPLQATVIILPDNGRDPKS